MHVQPSTMVCYSIFWPFFVYFLLFFMILGVFNMFGCIWMLHGIRGHMMKWAGNSNNLNWYIVSIFLHIFCILLILFSDSTHFSRVWKHLDITGCRRGWSVSPTICIEHYFTILVVILYIIINIIYFVYYPYGYPQVILHPWLRVGLAAGMGAGHPKFTCGSPVPITTRDRRCRLLNVFVRPQEYEYESC